MGLLSKVVGRIRSVADDDDLVIDDARTDSDEAVRIAQTVDRHRATVQGRVRALTLPTTTAVTALVVEVADSSGPIQLVFIGRKAIPGIECGVTLRAHGRVSIRRGTRIMYNPAYEIVPGRVT